ncbi:DUF1656 domain-containing protein [Azospirillum picis]|uniref:DUF1656 domain-containing protein n=1 Tax=Azospirillum picis TaxID=488438 RepID=A0ABU0MHD2_9PROT|nr:DUF1656 domain-containing protein [Azospirillum picis]MBP2298922.1 hypothetical protein [Azospirillum picis]MDQ0532836.1 hypothetical protein [Azospirillum picis]
MIVDFSIAGVFIPGLLVLAFVSLVATMAMVRVFSVTGISRLFAFRPLVETATFLIIYGLLMQSLPLMGLLS